MVKEDVVHSNRSIHLKIASNLHVADDALLERRLLELGFFAGARVEVVATMWPDDDPLAVRIGGATFALRRHEAALVQVDVAARDTGPDA